MGWIALKKWAEPTKEYGLDSAKEKIWAGQPTHVAMEGKSAQLKQMQNYELGFVRKASEAIVEDMEKRWKQREIAKIYMAEEVEETKNSKTTVVSQENKQLMKSHGKRALQVVTKLHRQLGHPGTERFVRALKDANMNDSIIQCARSFKCDICQEHGPKKLDNPASLPQAQHFNELLEADVFHLKWDENGGKQRVLAILDVYSRYEVNTLVDRETEEIELKVLEEQWIQVFGPPKRFRTDSSGAHMSQKYLDFFDKYNIKLLLVPKDSHSRMGTVERLHAVRRLQLLKLKKEIPDISLSDAIRICCQQRNRLRSVQGSSPCQIVFGHNPFGEGLLDEPLDERPPGTSAIQQDQHLRYAAGRAFYEANHSELLRRSLLARQRTEPDQTLQLGDFAYYWRQGEQKLEARWRGPALVVAIEPRSDGHQTPSVYWSAHGTSLVRPGAQNVRPEVAREQVARLTSMPDTALSASVRARLKQALDPVQGPVRFLDVSGGTSFADAKGIHTVTTPTVHSPNTDLPMDIEYEPTEPDPEAMKQEEEAARNNAAATNHSDSRLDETTTAAAETAAATNHSDSRLDKTTSAAAEAKAKTTEHAAKETEEPRNRSRSPPPKDERHRAFESYNQARALDGLPPVDWTGSRFHARMDASELQDQRDEALALAEGFNERLLNPEEKKQFDEAKTQALQVWFDNQAWKPVPETDAQEGECVPARFLQRWKPTKDGKKANARVIIQGFRHLDVLEQKLDTESPTLSMTGRQGIYIYTVHKQWKLFSADVKSAFMQSDSIDQTTRIYVKPSSDMRRRLEQMCGLKPWEILKATKPAFGDVRAPRQWHNTADAYLVNELKFVHHPLDRCLYLSLRAAVPEDDPFCVFEKDGIKMTVDGILGLHVDDFVGSGEHVHKTTDFLKKDIPEGDYFLSRLARLSRRFRFGSWDFGESGAMLFCGADIVQSLDYSTITISLANYIQKVKPITLEKARKTMVDDLCDEREHRQLRALIGALAWPANQCVPQLSASVSLLQAAANKPFIRDVNEANKLLRYAKEISKDFKLRIRAHGPLESLRLGAYSDASWAARPDGSSQGGMLIFACSQEELDSGMPMPLTIMAWHSKKLPRICRSSLAAESQALAGTIDELEWCKIFLTCFIDLSLPIEGDAVLQKMLMSPVATDAKSLFDATHSITAGMKLSERRAAIEITIIKQRLEAILGELFWVNSHQQLADGLTKSAARDSMAVLMQRGTHKLSFDPSFVAAKKITQQERDLENHEHEVCARTLQTEQSFFQESVEHHGELCLLPGCGKVRDCSDPQNRFCSRRHFYKFNARKGGQDPWRMAAAAAVVTLMAEAPKAEAHEVVKNEAQDDWNVFKALAVIFTFA